MHERRRDVPAQHRVARIPLLLRRQFFQKLHFARRIDGDRQSIQIQQPIAGERRQPRTGGDDAEQIQRIGAGQRDVLLRVGPAPHLAQQRHGVRRRVLLARKAGDEAAAANLAARLQAAAAREDLAPRRQPARFAREQLPENARPSAAATFAPHAPRLHRRACRKMRRRARRTMAQRPASAIANRAMCRLRRAP